MIKKSNYVAAPVVTAWKCLVVLPTFNERDNLGDMVASIERHLVTDILIVDDNSPDGTGDIADEIAERSQHVHVMHRPGKLGLGTAYIEGFEWGFERDYERFIQMDCDFSHDPADLPRLVQSSESADLVIGSRYVAGGSTEGWSFRRRLLSRGANAYTKLFLGSAVHDWTAGFRCFTRDILSKIDFRTVSASGFSYQIQMAFTVRKAGGEISEIPIRFVDRHHGESKMDRAIALEALRVIPALRFRG